MLAAMPELIVVADPLKGAVVTVVDVKMLPARPVFIDNADPPSDVDVSMTLTTVPEFCVSAFPVSAVTVTSSTVPELETMPVALPTGAGPSGATVKELPVKLVETVHVWSGAGPTHDWA